MGEAVVSGEVTPDSYVIGKLENKITDKIVSNKKVGLFKNSLNENEWFKIAADQAKRQVLTDDQILNYVTDFLQQAHSADERYTVRDGINIIRFSLKMAHAEKVPASDALIRTAVVQTLGEEALRYVA